MNGKAVLQRPFLFIVYTLIVNVYQIIFTV
jgi:hypothetical protein